MEGDKLTALMVAWEALEGPYAASTRYGPVVLHSVREHSDGEMRWVEVWTGEGTKGGDPHFRIVNPPVLVEDPSGDLEHAGRRWREDPLAALAEVVGQHGGAQLPRRKRRIQG